MNKNFVVCKFSDYVPHVYIKDGWDNYDVSKFNVEFNIAQSPRASLTIPYQVEEEETYINAPLVISLKDKIIFNGLITNSTYDMEGLTLKGMGYSYLFQRIYNQSVIFDTRDDGLVYISDAITSIFNGTVEIQNLQGKIDLIIDNSILDKETLKPQNSYFPNLDNYTILKKLADLAGLIFIESLDPSSGKNKFYFIKFTNLTQYIPQYIILDNYYYERTKANTGEGLIDGLFIIDKQNDNSLTLYPDKKPGYLPSNTKIDISEQGTEFYNKYLNKKVQFGLAVYDALNYGSNKPEDVLKDKGEHIIRASFMNSTSATFKLPGLQSSELIIFPGTMVGTSEHGNGIANKVSYDFNEGTLWQTINIWPRVGV